jgi:hypothetical protein
MHNEAVHRNQSITHRIFFVKKLPVFWWFAALAAITSNIAAQDRVPPSAGAAGKPFLVFDNMGYVGKPDLSTNGLIPSCVIYYHGDWKKAVTAGRLPDEKSFKEAIRSRSAGKPGPVVIDIEYVYLSQTHGTTDDEVKQHFKLFITLAKWAHEAAPGHLVGFYGHGLFPEEPGTEYSAETRQLIAAVDAFFPSMYIHGNQTAAQWRAKLQTLLAQAHELAPGKPVYPYVCPQYHEGGPKALEFVDPGYMKFQLETARDSGASGVVFWASGKFRWEDAPWLHALLQFVAENPQCRSDVELQTVKPGKAGPSAAYETE